MVAGGWWWNGMAGDGAETAHVNNADDVHLPIAFTLHLLFSPGLPALDHRQVMR